MRRVVWVVTIAMLAAASSTAQNKPPGFVQPSWTWAQVVQGAADNPKTVPHRPLTKDFKPYSYGDDTNNDYKYDGEDKFDKDYEYSDDAEFENNDYYYVDDINEVENPDQFQYKNENANRRVLDFLYHTFAQPMMNPDQPPQPSLLGEVFQVIDNHINKDFTSLANLIAQGTATANPASAQQPAAAYGTPVATSIAAGPTPDDFLVTDDFGNQHLVSVDDIVQSLSVLDERSLVDLILAPEGAQPDPSLSIQLPPGNQISRAPDLPVTQTASAPLNSFQLPAPAPAPLPVSVTPSSASPSDGGVPLPSASPASGGVPLPSSQNLPLELQNIVDTSEVVILPAQLTKAIRNAAATHGGEVFRPVRHTGPTNSATTDEESFLITDEQGNVQIITMNDILSSLTNLDEESLTSLLRETAEADSLIRQLQTSSNSTSSPNIIDIPDSVPVSTADSPPAAPLIETDYDGNVHIRPSESGSIKIDLNDHTAEHSKLKEPSLPTVVSTTPAPPSPPPSPPPTKKKPVISSDGTSVSTDQDGNIYITPDPDKPFTLDIANIIALAEQAEQGQTNEDKASEFSGAIVNQLPSTKTSTPTPIPAIPERGNQILAYLAGVESFLPNPILPGPIRPAEPEQPVQPQVSDFRTALLNTLTQHSQSPLRLHGQPEQQTTPAPATPGIGAQLSGILSRIVNQARQVVGTQPEAPVSSEPQDEVIQLVIREQFEDGGEEIYGNINVPLPQGIHHSKEALQRLKAQGNGRNSNEAQRRQDTVKNWKDGLPTSVVEAVLGGVYKEPEFNILNAYRSGESSQKKVNLITQKISEEAGKSDSNKFNPTVTAQERESHFQTYGDGSEHSSPPQSVYAPGPAPDSDEYGPPRPNSIYDPASAPQPAPYEPPQPDPQPAPYEPPKPAPQPVEYEAPVTIYESKPVPHYEEPSYHKPPVTHYEEPKLPLFDLYLLADFNKANKLGYEHDGSIGAPLIGDPSYFVDTRHKHHHY